MTIRHELVTSSCRKGQKGCDSLPGTSFPGNDTALQDTLPGRCRGPHKPRDLETSNRNIYVAFRGDMINREQGYSYRQSWLLSGTPCSLGLDSSFLPLPFNLIKSTIIEPTSDTVGSVKMKKFDPKGKSESIKHNRDPEIKNLYQAL